MTGSVRAPASRRVGGVGETGGMCGRYASTRRDDELADQFRIDQVLGEGPGPSWNVAPTDPVRVVLERAEGQGPQRQLRTVRWGLVPSWAKDPGVGARMINARVETVTEKPAFRRAAASRRAIVPMDGYFEWQRTPAGKVPYFLTAADDAQRGLAAAGLYELWPDPSRPADDPDRWRWTVTVLTRSATDALGHIHDRTPVLLPPGLWDEWLDLRTTSLTDVRSLLDAVPEPHLLPREVGAAVGNVRNNGPELVAPVG